MNVKKINAQLVKSFGAQFVPADVSDWDGTYCYFGTLNGVDYDIRRVDINGNAVEASGDWADRMTLVYD